MDNMKPLLDAVKEATATGDITKATATGDTNDAMAGRQTNHDSTKGRQRESSCGRRGPNGTPWWASTGWSCGPPMGQPFAHPCGPPMGHPFGGPSGGYPFGPSGGHPFGPSGGHPFGPSGGYTHGPSERHPFEPSGVHPFGPSGGHPFGPPGGHQFGPSFGPSERIWGGRGPSFMNCPTDYACPWDRGTPPMNDFCPWGNITGSSSMHGPPTFGPMVCPWDAIIPCDDEPADGESDEGAAGKENAGDAGKENAGDAGKENAENTGKDELNPPKQKDGARAEKSERPRRMCPWSEGMRRRRIRCSSRHGNNSCRRQDPFSMCRRCRRGPWAQSRYAPWAAFSGDCCQQAAPTGWKECPYPCSYWSGESNTDPDTDNQKQDGDQPTPKECCRFYKGAPWFGRHGGCSSGRRWQGGPSRNNIYKMLSRRRNMLKEKLQRVESMLGNMQPSEEEAKKTTVGGDGNPQPAAAQMETGKTRKTNTDREWEMIADSE